MTKVHSLLSPRNWSVFLAHLAGNRHFSHGRPDNEFLYVISSSHTSHLGKEYGRYAPYVFTVDLYMSPTANIIISSN